MKTVIRKIFIMLILIIFFIYIESPLIYASLAQNAQHESGPIPPPATPPDSPSTPPSEPAEEEPESDPYAKYISISCPDTITGNVYEDLGFSKPSSNPGSDDTIQKGGGIGNVIVSLRRS